MNEKDRELLRQIYSSFSDSTPEQLQNSELKQTELAQPDPTYDKTVRNIYKQAHKHRDRLIDFYINYTSCFMIVILTLILAQAIVRIMSADKKFEIMPQWTLNILVSGMFVQFVGLLKIVTENAWNFKSFFDHHNDMRSDKKIGDEDKL